MKSSKELLMGNHAVSHGVRLARAEVISAYPITPQTQIVEELSNMCSDGRLRSKFIKVESEHSAMACCIGASQTGARAFTATSAQGLALMHELLFWAAYSRLPIVLANVNRAMAPGWSIWSDQTDSLAQRDTGWIQLYCETNQEVLDTTIIAYKLAEAVSLPAMIVYDAFILSHTYEPVDIPSQEDVDSFLPKRDAQIKLSTKNPLAFGALTTPEHYMEFRYIMEMAHWDALNKFKGIAKDFNKIFKRSYEPLEEYKTEDAETILIISGSVTSTARAAVDILREKGEKAGLLKLKMLRPFPSDDLYNILGNIDGRDTLKKIAVFDRNISHGMGGIWQQEIRSCLCGKPRAPEVYSYLIGLGGRDITEGDFIKGYELTSKGAQKEPVWLGLKR